MKCDLIFLSFKSWSRHVSVCVDGYLGEEQLAVEQVGQLHQALLHRLPPAFLDIQVSPQWRLPMAREENAFSIHLIVKERDSGAHQVTGHVHHLCHQI